MNPVAEALEVVAFFVGTAVVAGLWLWLAALAWKGCLLLVQSVSRHRARVLTLEALFGVLVLAGGLVARAAILGQDSIFVAPLLVFILPVSIAAGLASFASLWTRRALYACILAVLFVGAYQVTEGMATRGPHPDLYRRHMLHEVYRAVWDFYKPNGDYPQSLEGLVGGGLLDRSVLDTSDGRSICYWRPRRDSMMWEIMAYYWSPEDGRTEVLYVDGGTGSAEVQPGKGLVNPRTGEVTWGPKR